MIKRSVYSFNRLFDRLRKDEVFSRRCLKAAAVSVLLVLISLMFPGGRAMQFSDLKEGSISTRRILAPYDFEILKTEDEYLHDQEKAARGVSRVFTMTGSQEDTAIRRLDELFSRLLGIRKLVKQNPAARRAVTDTLFAPYSLAVEDSVKRKLVQPGTKITDAKLLKFKDTLKGIIQDQLSAGIYDVEKPGPDALNHNMAVIIDGVENIYDYDDFFHISHARGQAFTRLKNDSDLPPPLLLLGYSLVDFLLRPNIRPDDELTQQRRQQARARVPVSSGLIFEKEMIVDENERITFDIRKKLDSLASKMSEKEGAAGIQRILPFIGRLVFVFFILYLFSVFITLEKPEIFDENKSIILISLIILLISVITFVLRRIGGSEFFIPAAMGAMLFSILFDAKVGYAGAAVLSLLCGALWGGEFNVMTVTFFTGVAGVVMTMRIRGRGQVVRIVFALVGAYLLVITVLGLLQISPLRQIAADWMYGALSGLLIPVITFGIIPLIESVFGVTTDFSLLELSNLNHPLLKKLSTTAPGTYHHSIIVGSLAEAGSQAAGANSLIARVGSYYHDIGKLGKEEYFIENQLPGQEPHAKLNPSMSALVLMNHVKKGVEVAGKYKLPRAIIDTIAQHHGTTVISYFYDKARKAANGGEVREEDYRYTGPVPQTKETAIVMLADAVEAASRTIRKPTHARLKGLVNTIVDGRFREGQLDQSPLTLRDLEKIKESFLTILAGIFHARIEYPDKDEE